jgi:hypothetical protein
MKRQSTLSLVLALSLFVSIVSFPLTAQAQQPPHRFRGNTGVITLGMGQVLRITVNGLGGADAIRVRFAWMKYMPAGCNTDGVCRHVIQSEGATAPVNIGPNQAASFEVQGTGNGVRVEVRVNTADVIGDACIINSATGEVTSHVIIANTEG